MIEWLEKLMCLEEVEDKTALVTGASSGIGFEFAKVLARNKYDLVLVARNRSRLDGIKNDLHQAYGVKVHVIACDLSQVGACGDIYGQVRKKNLDIDILINNAGVGDWGLFVDSNLEKQEQMPGMIDRRQGKILNVSSTAAFQPGPLMSVYFATKAYVLSFSRAIAQELKDTGVSVTCLCPGPTATNFQSLTFPKEIRLTYGRKLPSPQEIAEYGYKVMLRGQGIAIHGILNRLMALNARFFPQWITLRLVHFMQSTEQEKGQYARFL